MTSKNSEKKILNYLLKNPKDMKYTNDIL